MTGNLAVAKATLSQAGRKVVERTRGSGSGPIVRLMSPHDLGQHLKPFVFLDLMDTKSSIAREMKVHPHSGIATITVLTEGDLRFDKGKWGTGTLDYGGVEWMRAGSGIWHGDEYQPGVAPRVRGFQLWIALPAGLEASSPEWQFVESRQIPEIGPAHLIFGAYRGKQSPVRSPDGVNYLLVTLRPGEEWIYATPLGHDVGWLAVSQGSVSGEGLFAAGEMIAFDRSDAPIPLRAGANGATFVLGSAVPHPHDLVLGYYSVHTSKKALEAGEARIAEIRELYA